MQSRSVNAKKCCGHGCLVIKNACGDKVTGGGCGRRATIQTMPRMSTITATSTEMVIMSTTTMTRVCQICPNTANQQISGSETVFKEKQSVRRGQRNRIPFHGRFPWKKNCRREWKRIPERFFFHSIRRQRRKKNSFRRHKRGRHGIRNHVQF